MPSFVMLFAVTNALAAAFFTVSIAEPAKKPGRAIVPAMNGPIAVSVAKPAYNVENPLEIVSPTSSTLLVIFFVNVTISLN